MTVKSPTTSPAVDAKPARGVTDAVSRGASVVVAQVEGRAGPDAIAELAAQDQSGAEPAVKPGPESAPETGPETASETGARIRARRLDRGQRQADLAAQVGISPAYLNLIEHGKRRIGGKVLVALARALDVEPYSLTEGPPPRVSAALSF